MKITTIAVLAFLQKAKRRSIKNESCIECALRDGKIKLAHDLDVGRGTG